MEIDEFLNEFTNNFSELFVETFIIKYKNIYNDNKCLKYIELAQKITNKKINQKIAKKQFY